MKRLFILGFVFLLSILSVNAITWVNITYEADINQTGTFRVYFNDSMDIDMIDYESDTTYDVVFYNVSFTDNRVFKLLNGEEVTSLSEVRFDSDLIINSSEFLNSSNYWVYGDYSLDTALNNSMPSEINTYTLNLSNKVNCLNDLACYFETEGQRLYLSSNSEGDIIESPSPINWLNQNLAFDLNDSTYADEFRGNDQDIYLGKTFNETYVSNVFVKAELYTINSYTSNINLEYYDGSTWIFYQTLSTSGCGGCGSPATAYFEGNISLNKSIQGLRINYYGIGTSSTKYYSYLYSLEYTPETYTFSTNGNKSYNISNSENDFSSTLLVNPTQYVTFANSDLDPVNNYQVNGTNYTDIFSFNVFDYGYGNHTFEFTKPNYLTKQFTLEINSTSQINTSVSLTDTKIIISLYNRETGDLITDNVTVTLIGDVGLQDSTITGLINFSNETFTNSDYQLLAQSDNYISETRYFTYDNQENVYIDFYLFNETTSNAGVVSVDVEDQYGQNIEGAIVSLLEWKPSSSSYTTVSQGKTNSNGRVSFDIELDDKVYKVSAVKEGTSVESVENIIKETDQLIPLTLIPSEVTAIGFISGLSGSLVNTSYNSTHQIVTFSIVDLNGIATKGEINIYSIKGINKQLLYTYSDLSSSFELITSPFKINQTYEILVEGAVYDGDSKVIFDTIKYDSSTSLSKYTDNLGLLIIIPIVLAIAGISLGFMIGNMFIGAVSVVISVWASSIFASEYMPTEIAIAITVITGLIIWGGYKVK